MLHLAVIAKERNEDKPIEVPAGEGYMWKFYKENGSKHWHQVRMSKTNLLRPHPEPSEHFGGHSIFLCVHVFFFLSHLKNRISEPSATDVYMIIYDYIYRYIFIYYIHIHIIQMCIWNLFRETAKFGVDTYEEDSSFSSFATFEFHLI